MRSGPLHPCCLAAVCRGEQPATGTGLNLLPGHSQFEAAFHLLVCPKEDFFHTLPLNKEKLQCLFFLASWYRKYRSVWYSTSIHSCPQTIYSFQIELSRQMPFKLVATKLDHSKMLKWSSFTKLSSLHSV